MDEPTRLSPRILRMKRAGDDTITIRPPVESILPADERLHRVCLVAIGPFGEAVLETVESGEPIQARTVNVTLGDGFDEHAWQTISLDVRNGRFDDPDAVATACYEVRGIVSRATGGFDLVIVLADLSSIEGRALSGVISSIARRNSKTILGMAVMPFDFESSRVIRAADAALVDWRREAHTLVDIRRSRMAGVTSEDDPIADVLLNSARWVVDGIRAFAATAANPLSWTPASAHWPEFLGIGNVYQAGWASVPGDAALKQAAELALDRSFLTRADMLSAGPALIQIVSAHTPMVREINEISEFIRNRAGKDFDPRFAFGVDPHLVNRTICAVWVCRAEKPRVSRNRPQRSPASHMTRVIKNGAGIFGLHNGHKPRELNLDVPPFLRRRSA